MSSRQEYQEFRPVELFDVAVMESWLEERDREGYHLLRFRGLRGIFYQDRSVDPSRYRLQPLLRKEKLPPQEMTEAYRELGWEYVCTLAGTFHVWRCEDPDAPELDTDPVVQGMGVWVSEKKMRRRLLRLPAILLLCLGIIVLPWVWGAGDMPLVDQLEQALPGEGLFWLLMVAGAIGFELLDAFRCAACCAPSRPAFLWSGPGPGGSKSGSPRWRWCWGGRASWYPCFSPNSGDPHFTRSAMGEDGEPLAEVVCLDLRELEGTEELTYLSAERKSLLPAPQMYWTRQSTEGPGGQFQTIFGNTSYYRLRTEDLALRVEAELRTWQEWFGGGEPGSWRSPAWTASGGPGMTCPSQRDDPCQCVVARRGNCVLMFSYTGHTDLRTRGELFAALLENGTEEGTP